nr:30S ribosomal protein S1 [Pseudomonadota bacterium]
MSENFADLLAESLDQNRLQVGSVIQATVVAVGDDAVLVNAGLKSDAVIDISEFKSSTGAIECREGDI